MNSTPARESPFGGTGHRWERTRYRPGGIGPGHSKDGLKSAVSWPYGFGVVNQAKMGAETDAVVGGRALHPWIAYSPDSVFILSFPPDHDIQALREAFADVERISAEADRAYGFILDFAKITHSSAQGRSIVAASERRINQMEPVKTHCRGVGFVVRNEFQKGVLTAVNWFARRPYEFSVFISRQEAGLWVARRMGLERLRPAS